MRCLTAAQLKGVTKKPLRTVPREGTKIRAAFDLFQSRKGLPVEFRQDVHSPRIVEYLKNSYGMDIRKIQNGTWVFAGEWFGRVYVDYIAEHVA